MCNSDRFPLKPTRGKTYSFQKMEAKEMPRVPIEGPRAEGRTPKAPWERVRSVIATKSVEYSEVRVVRWVSFLPDLQQSARSCSMGVSFCLRVQYAFSDAVKGKPKGKPTSNNVTTTRSSRIRVPTFFRTTILVGEPSTKKG